MTKGKDWDDREKERTGKEIMDGFEYLSKLYISLVKEYAKLNDTEMPDLDDEGHYDLDLYDFLYDEKFIDFAFKKSGVKFEESMFKFDSETTEKIMKEAFKAGNKGVVSLELFQIYSPLVDEYVESNNIKIPPNGSEWPPGAQTKNT